jgi:hypothetical protein
MDTNHTTITPAANAAPPGAIPSERGLGRDVEGLDGATVMIESSVGFRVIPDGVP